MSVTQNCPQCGAELPGAAFEGLCPKCMVQVMRGIPTPVLATEKPGDKIGSYKLLQQLGEGGCGVVYMAEQQEPVRRKVALKVIKLGMDTKQVVARFEAERQALALMDHPNIAKVFDAGATDTGRPYFVMELVRGIKITEYCDQNQLSTIERLDLFIQVCQAIQHAHQKGIIHRDIKPSNILVTQHDTVAVPKVIDFGIAKATSDQPLTDKTLFTAFEQFMGTPAYMSPEQAQMSGLDIDTRTDIYSLGVLLYELLTGQTPFDAKELIASGLDAMRRTICDKEPVRPSTKLKQTGVANSARDSAKSAIGNRQSAIDPDLDWVVMKCLEKDRTRRYETANGLAADLKRHLANEPVVARPPSTAYRFQKMVRRNKFAFAAATAVVGVLVLGTLVSTWLAFEATRARDDEKQERWRAERGELVARQNAYAADMNVVQHALEDGNYGLARRTLEAHRPAPGQEDLRGFEWRYFWKLSEGESLETWRGHSNLLMCVAISPDGKTLASGSYDSSVRLWDLASAHVTTTFSIKTGLVNSVAFSPDGRFLAVGNYMGPAQLWELASGRMISSFDGEWSRVTFSPVQMLLAVSSGADIARGGAVNATVSVWDCTRLPLTKTFTQSGGHAAFSPDGNILAVVDHAIKLWDIATEQLRQTLTNSGSVISLAFSPDGQRLVASNEKGEVLFWDLATGHQGTPLSGHTARVWGVAFSPDGQTLATASADHTIGLWDVVSQRRKGHLKGHGGAVKSVAFLPDGKRLVSASHDETLKLWSAEPKEATERTADYLVLSPSYDVMLRQGRRQGISFGVFVYSEDGLLMAAPGEDGVNVWDLATNQVLGTITNEFRALALIDRGRTLVTINTNYVLRFWDWERQLLRTNFVLSTTDAPISTAQLDPGGKVLATATRGGRVSFWNPANGSSLGAIQANRGVVGLAVSPDGKRLATASDDGTSKIIDVKTRSELVLNSHRDNVLDVAFSGDGRFLVTASGDATAKLWEVSTGKIITTLIGHKEVVFSVAFASDGRTLATADDHTVKLWHLATYRELATFKDDRQINGIAFSPDGRKLGAAAMDGSLRFWSAPTLAEIEAAEKEASKSVLPVNAVSPQVGDSEAR